MVQLSGLTFKLHFFQLVIEGKIYSREREKKKRRAILKIFCIFLILILNFLNLLIPLVLFPCHPLPLPLLFFSLLNYTFIIFKTPRLASISFFHFLMITNSVHIAFSKMIPSDYSFFPVSMWGQWTKAFCSHVTIRTKPIKSYPRSNHPLTNDVICLS